MCAPVPGLLEPIFPDIINQNDFQYSLLHLSLPCGIRIITISLEVCLSLFCVTKLGDHTLEDSNSFLSAPSAPSLHVFCFCFILQEFCQRGLMKKRAAGRAILADCEPSPAQPLGANTPHPPPHAPFPCRPHRDSPRATRSIPRGRRG